MSAQPKVGGVQARFERVLSAGKRHGNVRGQNVARRKLGLLSRLTRETRRDRAGYREEFRSLYSDKNLTCADCGQEFVFTASEQEVLDALDEGIAIAEYIEPGRLNANGWKLFDATVRWLIGP